LEQALAKMPSCVPLLSLLSYVLLQEDRDLATAERLLLDILALDPANASARQNLAVLRRRLSA
jgi:hypothetical protein